MCKISAKRQKFYPWPCQFFSCLFFHSLCSLQVGNFKSQKSRKTNLEVPLYSYKEMAIKSYTKKRLFMDGRLTKASFLLTTSFDISSLVWLCVDLRRLIFSRFFIFAKISEKETKLKEK